VAVFASGCRAHGCAHTLQNLNKEHQELHNNQQSKIFMFGGRPMADLKRAVEQNRRRFTR
jgi:hypothetical protein